MIFLYRLTGLDVDKTLPLRARARATLDMRSSASSSTMLVLICIPFLDPFTLAASPVCEACQFYQLLSNHSFPSETK